MQDRLDRVKENIQIYKTVPVVTVVCATKTVCAQRVAALPTYGLTVAGENRVQELCEKYAQIGDSVTWRLIGRLQTNKVKKVVGIVDCIESVDSRALVDEIAKQAEKKQVCVDVLLQVNAGGEKSKGGVSPSEVGELLEYASKQSRIRVRGLMGVFPKHAEEALYAKMKQTFDEYKEKYGLDVLSMGMSDDYVTALKHGATEIRLGKALLGERPTREPYGN